MLGPSHTMVFGLAFGLVEQFISEFMLSYAFFITTGCSLVTVFLNV